MGRVMEDIEYWIKEFDEAFSKIAIDNVVVKVQCPKINCDIKCEHKTPHVRYTGCSTVCLAILDSDGDEYRCPECLPITEFITKNEMIIK